MLDERFFSHQMKSMRLAVRVGALLMGASFMYKYFKEDYLDWQLALIMVVIALVKIGAMVYYRKTN